MQHHVQFRPILTISFYPERHLSLSRNTHLRSQLSKHRVCLSFCVFEKRGGFNHSRIQFIDIVFFSQLNVQIADQQGLKTRLKTLKYRTVCCP